MHRFKTVTLNPEPTLKHPEGHRMEGPVVTVTGPIDDPERVRHLIFMLIQGDLSADAHAQWKTHPAEWQGEVSNVGFKEGEKAQGLAVAVVASDDTPPSYDVLTWAQEVIIPITEGQSAATSS
jgi:hypothetical protein